MVPRTPLETHFEQFWSQVAKWLPGGLWAVILSSSGTRWPTGSQEASADVYPAHEGGSMDRWIAGSMEQERKAT